MKPCVLCYSFVKSYKKNTPPERGVFIRIVCYESKGKSQTGTNTFVPIIILYQSRNALLEFTHAANGERRFIKVVILDPTVAGESILHCEKHTLSNGSPIAVVISV